VHGADRLGTGRVRRVPFQASVACIHAQIQDRHLLVPAGDGHREIVANIYDDIDLRPIFERWQSNHRALPVKSRLQRSRRLHGNVTIPALLMRSTASGRLRPISSGIAFMRFLENLSIRLKLTVLVILSVLAPAAVLAVGSTFVHQRMVNDRIDVVRSAVELAVGVAEGLNSEVEARTITRDEALSRFRNAVHAMSYHNRADYLFAYDLRGIAVANPSNHKAVGTDRTQLQDKTGKYFVREIIETLQKHDNAVVR
jgi:hypothetical protein